MISFLGGNSYMPLNDESSKEIFFAFDNHSIYNSSGRNMDFILKLNPDLNDGLSLITLADSMVLESWFLNRSDASVPRIMSVLNDSLILFSAAYRDSVPVRQHSFILNSQSGYIDTLKIENKFVDAPSKDLFSLNRNYFIGHDNSGRFRCTNLTCDTTITLHEEPYKLIEQSSSLIPGEKSDAMEFVDYLPSEKLLRFRLKTSRKGRENDLRCSVFSTTAIVNIHTESGRVEYIPSKSFQDLECKTTLTYLKHSTGYYNLLMLPTEKTSDPRNWDQYQPVLSYQSWDGSSKEVYHRKTNGDIMNGKEVFRLWFSNRISSTNFLYFVPFQKSLDMVENPFSPNWKPALLFQKKAVKPPLTSDHYYTRHLEKTSFESTYLIYAFNLDGLQVWSDSICSLNPANLSTVTTMSNDRLLIEVDINFHEDALVLNKGSDLGIIDYKKTLPLKSDYKPGYGIKSVIIYDSLASQKFETLKNQDQITLKCIIDQPEYGYKEYSIHNKSGLVGKIPLSYFKTKSPRNEGSGNRHYIMINGLLSVYDESLRLVMFNDNTLSTEISDLKEFEELSLMKYFDFVYGIKEIQMK